MAKYGVDDEGRPYVHMKAWKQRRLIAEFVQTQGVVMLRCRKCLRWHKITIHGREPVRSQPQRLPASLHVE